MKILRNLRYPNNAMGQAKKVDDLQFYMNQGFRIVSETITPGKFRGNEACCLALICLPLAFTAGSTEGVINLTLERDVAQDKEGLSIQEALIQAEAARAKLQHETHQAIQKARLGEIVKAMAIVVGSLFAIILVSTILNRC